VRLPSHAGLLLASGPLDGELLPPDTTVWLRAVLGRFDPAPPNTGDQV
jgi:hypothetical protein